MQLKVTEIINETEDAVSVVLKNNALFNKVKYKAGQFLTVKIPIENKIEKRAYSFSSSPVTDKFLQITVKKVKEGLVSTYICDQLRVGQKLEIEKPAGSFYVDSDKKATNRYVLFAAGSGITPIFSITKTVLEKEPLSSVLIFYANRNPASIIFKKHLEVLEEKYPKRFSIEHILEETSEEKPNYHQDLLNEDLVTELFLKHKLAFEDGFYMMCGPHGYMDVAKEILANKGIPRNKIKLEAFEVSTVITGDSKDMTSAVTIHQEDGTHTIQAKGDKTILQSAMAERITLPYSCRSGMCSSCKAKCISGEVRMIDGHFLTDEEVAEGNILTCISFPLTEKVGISFVKD
ncbi:ferredoxin--NADP reductase [Aquimarina sp. ERC-38]|uniref:ferredoxin--NADP reductase n=1 Tax=Aquimarina sp. ERC-38 TaxID=2949996 RepID=UPI0022479CFA|nr:ferredoxin--NADP reductase [Aquimarina sp. ERC-38]UZO81068.1 ferredoxin--NADP reductase [Aquimarina sp. ERC-38]